MFRVQIKKLLAKKNKTTARRLKQWGSQRHPEIHVRMCTAIITPRLQKAHLACFLCVRFSEGLPLLPDSFIKHCPQYNICNCNSLKEPKEFPKFSMYPFFFMGLRLDAPTLVWFVLSCVVNCKFVAKVFSNTAGMLMAAMQQTFITTDACNAIERDDRHSHAALFPCSAR